MIWQRYTLLCRMLQNLLCTAIFNTTQRVLIGFRSDWAIALLDLSFLRSHSFVHFDLRWLIFVLEILTDSCRFCAQIDWHLEPSILIMIPSILPRSAVPGKVMQPQSTMLPPPCFTVARVFFVWNSAVFFCQTYAQKFLPWCHNITKQS